jgi:hypothetical protein
MLCSLKKYYFFIVKRKNLYLKLYTLRRRWMGWEDYKMELFYESFNLGNLAQTLHTNQPVIHIVKLVEGICLMECGCALYRTYRIS